MALSLVIVGLQWVSVKFDEIAFQDRDLVFTDRKKIMKVS